MSQRAKLEGLLKQLVDAKQSIVDARGGKTPLHPGVGHTGAGEKKGGNTVKTVGTESSNTQGGNTSVTTQQALPKTQVDTTTTGHTVPDRFLYPLVRSLQGRGRKDPALADVLNKLKGGMRLKQSDHKLLDLEMADIMTHRDLKAADPPKNTRGGFWPILAASLAPIALNLITKLTGKGVSGGSFKAGGSLSGAGLLTGGTLSGGTLSGGTLSGGRGAGATLSGGNEQQVIKTPGNQPDRAVEIIERPIYTTGMAKKNYVGRPAPTKALPTPKTVKRTPLSGGKGQGFQETEGDRFNVLDSEGTMASWNPKGVSRKHQTGAEPVPPNARDPSKNLMNSHGGRQAKSSSWIDHVKAVSQSEGISYREALKVASKSYKK